MVIPGGVVAKVPLAVKKGWQVLDLVLKGRTISQVWGSRWKAGDLLTIERSSYAYFSPSAHNATNYRLLMRMRLQRKEGSSWRVKYTETLSSVRIVIRDAVSRPVYIRPTVVYRW